MGTRPVLLVLTSTYPRWKGDPEPAFVHELCRRQTDRFEVHVLCPHSAGASRREAAFDGVTVHRYRYAPDALETLVSGGGSLANLKRSPWKWLLVPSYFIAQIGATLTRVRRLKPQVVHCHWIVLQGVVVATLSAIGI